MFSTLAILGLIAALTVPGLCCMAKEYKTNSGECCPMCHEGTVVRRECTQLSGTRCSPCENGTYMDEPNGFTKCFLCTTCDKGLGLSVLKECTAKRDTVCDALKGYFCEMFANKTGCSLAKKHKPCEAGYWTKAAGTNRADTVCEPCNEGYFSEDGLTCTVWTNCSNQVKKKEGSATSDVVCSSARSHYSYIPLLLTILTLFGLGIRASRPLAGQKLRQDGRLFKLQAVSVGPECPS